MNATIRMSMSISDMLSEALAICHDKTAMLLLLEVSAECPGLLPQREMRQSHDAAAMVSPAQLCGKMGQLVEVLDVMLAASPSLDCAMARKECDESIHCKTALQMSKKRGGSAHTAVAEALRLCDDKDAMLLTLRVAVECQQSLPGRDDMTLGGTLVLDSSVVLGSTYAALEPLDPAELCDQARILEEQLLPRLSSEALPPTMAEAPWTCSKALTACHANTRCIVLTSSLQPRNVTGPAAVSHGVLEVLQLCTSMQEMQLVLAVESACPGQLPEGFTQNLRHLVDSTPGNALCGAALKFMRTNGASFLPSEPLPQACVEAQQDCGANKACKLAARTDATQEALLRSALHLCHDGNEKQAMLLILRVATECPGPLPQVRLRDLGVALAKVPDAELCTNAAKAEEGFVSPASQRRSSASLRAALVEAVDEELPALTAHVAEHLVDAFDVLPHDGVLNALELGALLASATQQELVGLRQVALEAFQMRIPIGKRELIKALRTGLRSKLQKLAWSD